MGSVVAEFVSSAGQLVPLLDPSVHVSRESGHREPVHDRICDLREGGEGRDGGEGGREGGREGGEGRERGREGGVEHGLEVYTMCM